MGQRQPEERPGGDPLSERAARGAQEKIVFADEQLVATADTKIATGDVVLTYAASSVVLEVLLHSHQARGRPRPTLARRVAAGPHRRLKCYHVPGACSDLQS